MVTGRWLGDRVMVGSTLSVICSPTSFSSSPHVWTSSGFSSSSIFALCTSLSTVDGDNSLTDAFRSGCFGISEIYMINNHESNFWKLLWNGSFMWWLVFIHKYKQKYVFCIQTIQNSSYFQICPFGFINIIGNRPCSWGHWSTLGSSRRSISVLQIES